MKKTDIAMIILIATVGVMVSFFVVRGILGNASSEPQKIQVIDPINADMPEVDERIFNSSAINPSVEVEIEGSTVPQEGTQDSAESE